MRISDWSSDVCSSDLSAGTRLWGNSCRDWYQDAHGDRASQRNDGWKKSCRRSFDAEKPRLGCVTEEKRTARTRVYRGRKSAAAGRNGYQGTTGASERCDKAQRNIDRES